MLVAFALVATAAARGDAGDAPASAAALASSVRASPPANVPLPPPSDDPPLPPPPPLSGDPPTSLPPPSEIAPPPPPVAAPAVVAPAPVVTQPAAPPAPEAAPATTSGASAVAPAPTRAEAAAPRVETAAAPPAPPDATSIGAPAAADRPSAVARAAPPAVRVKPRRASRPAATAGKVFCRLDRGGGRDRDCFRAPAAVPQRLSELLPYDLRAHPKTALTLLASAFTLMLLGGSGRSLAAAGGGSSSAPSSGGAGDAAPDSEYIYEGVEIEHIGGAAAIVASGDRSRTWGWPGTPATDRLSSVLPARLAARSPLVARVVADGTYLRAILGSASLLVLVAGAVLGIGALRDTGGEALPPAATLTIAIAMLGVLDAGAGLLAVVIFFGGVLLLGGLDSNDDVRTLLGLSALWFVVPVLAGAARPLRRPAARNLAEAWDRAADFVIASLIGAWAVKNIVEALPGLAGLQLPIAAYANGAAYAVLFALVLRMTAETVASHLYPQRLTVAEAGELPDPSALQRLGACFVRATIFVYFAIVVVGLSWQLWVGTALFAIPQILSIYEDRLPRSPALSRALPKGLVELVVMLLVVTVLGALLIDAHGDSPNLLANSFVILSIPGFALSLAGLVGREADEPEMDWPRRLAGVVVLACGILLSLGMVP
jgi:hypothetical protein